MQILLMTSFECRRLGSQSLENDDPQPGAFG
jgi:hypothetical protein